MYVCIHIFKNAVEKLCRWIKDNGQVINMWKLVEVSEVDEEVIVL